MRSDEQAKTVLQFAEYKQRRPEDATKPQTGSPAQNAPAQNAPAQNAPERGGLWNRSGLSADESDTVVALKSPTPMGNAIMTGFTVFCCVYVGCILYGMVG